MSEEKLSQKNKRIESGKESHEIGGQGEADRLETLKQEVTIQTFRASGPGGQHRNVTDSGVRLVHHPSGIVVTATESRSQLRNKETAFERLIKRLDDLNRVQKRRIPTKKPRRIKAREIQEKQHLQQKKKLRKPSGLEDG